jgi:hypothetical protein
MKTTTKLTLALVVFGLIAAIVGTFGIYGIEKAVRADEGRTAAYDRAANRVEQIELRFQGLRLALREALFPKARPDAGLLDRQIPSLVSGIEADLADLRSDLGSDSSLDAYAALASAWNDYRPLIGRITRFARASSTGNGDALASFEGQSSVRIEAGFASLSQRIESDAAGASKTARAEAKAASRIIAGAAVLGLISSIAVALYLCRGLTRSLGGDPEELHETAADLAAGYIAPAHSPARDAGARGALASATERISAIFRATRSLTNAVSATSRHLRVAAIEAARSAKGGNPEEAAWIEDIERSSRELSAQAAELRDAIAYFSFSPKPAQPVLSAAPAALPSEELVEPGEEPDRPMTIAAKRANAALRDRSARGPRRGLYLLPHVKVASTRGAASIKAFRPDPPKRRLLKAGE